MRKKLITREIIADGIIMGMSSALLWHFSNIWRYEQYVVMEPNLVIRSIETGGLLFIFAFGLRKFITDLKR